MFSIECCRLYKRQSAITIARRFRGKQRNFTGEHFWERGYCVSTVGLDEQMVRECIRNQEQENDRKDQLKLGIKRLECNEKPFEGAPDKPPVLPEVT